MNTKLNELSDSKKKKNWINVYWKWMKNQMSWIKVKNSIGCLLKTKKKLNNLIIGYLLKINEI